MPDDDRREGKRALQERHWLHAKEQPVGENQSEPLESPVFLGYLQSDPTHTKLRIGLRQETNGQVDANDLVVKVDLFDAAGNPVAEGNKVSSEWKTAEENFGEIAAPVLMVNSSEVISEVKLTLVYKDSEVEVRRYTLTDR